jgi:hypothetical protein
MVTQELIDYIASRRKAGISVPQIRQELMTLGWVETDLDEAFKRGAQPNVPPPLPVDPRSGNGETSTVPPEVKGWSWGAAGLTWIWGIRFKVWLAFLTFAGPLAYIWWIVLGVKGREWAWQHNHWASIEQFKQAQKTWDRWGLWLFILSFLFGIGMIWFYLSLFTSGAIDTFSTYSTSSF